jgi:hypothetical protein
MPRKATPKPAPKVWYVEDCGNSPGRIYAVFASETDAENFASFFEAADVVERTLFYGQPPVCGYNE